jgi:uncharacterized protein (TIGR03067 family)
MRYLTGSKRALLALTLTAAAAIGADPAKKDEDRLQGVWTVTAAEHDGKALDRIKGNTLTVKGSRFTIKTKSAEFTGTFRLDPGKTPKAIDFQHESDVLRDKKWEGVYKLEGDELRICYAEADSGKDRPVDFVTSEGSGLLLTVLKREKP